MSLQLFRSGESGSPAEKLRKKEAALTDRPFTKVRNFGLAPGSLGISDRFCHGWCRSTICDRILQLCDCFSSHSLFPPYPPSHSVKSLAALRRIQAVSRCDLRDSNRPRRRLTWYSRLEMTENIEGLFCAIMTRSGSTTERRKSTAAFSSTLSPQSDIVESFGLRQPSFRIATDCSSGFHAGNRLKSPSQGRKHASLQDAYRQAVLPLAITCPSALGRTRTFDRLDVSQMLSPLSYGS